MLIFNQLTFILYQNNSEQFITNTLSEIGERILDSN